MCRLVFSQRLEETSLQISGKFSLHSSHLSGTLPHTFQLPQLSQAPLLVSSTQSVSQFLFGCLSQCQSPEISSRQKTRTIIGGRLTLFISLSLRDYSPALPAVNCFIYFVQFSSYFQWEGMSCTTYGSTVGCNNLHTFIWWIPTCPPCEAQFSHHLPGKPLGFPPF